MEWKLFGCRVDIVPGFNGILLYHRPPIHDIRIEGTTLIARILESDIDKSVREAVLLRNIGITDEDG